MAIRHSPKSSLVLDFGGSPDSEVTKTDFRIGSEHIWTDRSNRDTSFPWRMAVAGFMSLLVRWAADARRSRESQQSPTYSRDVTGCRIGCAAFDQLRKKAREGQWPKKIFGNHLVCHCSVQDGKRFIQLDETVLPPASIDIRVSGVEIRDPDELDALSKAIGKRWATVPPERIVRTPDGTVPPHAESTGEAMLFTEVRDAERLVELTSVTTGLGTIFWGRDLAIFIGQAIRVHLAISLIDWIDRTRNSLSMLEDEISRPPRELPLIQSTLVRLSYEFGDPLKFVTKQAEYWPDFLRYARDVSSAAQEWQTRCGDALATPKTPLFPTASPPAEEIRTLAQEFSAKLLDKRTGARRIWEQAVADLKESVSRIQRCITRAP